MKLLTLNFLTCAIKSCKTQPSSFPLHPRDASLEIVESELNLPFLKNILPRLMWEELRVIASEVRLVILVGIAGKCVGSQLPNCMNGWRRRKYRNWNRILGIEGMC
jgi:hypothetical protein